MSNSSPQQWFQLEERFFKGVDQKLLNDIRGKLQTAETAEHIMQVTGIQDAELAGGIAALNVSVDTLAAFRLAPLVEVAWADDRVEEAERFKILKAAEASGIGADEPAMKLIDAWLKTRPPADLMDAWCDYTQALCSSLAEGHRAALKQEILTQVKSVAKANGGLLGFGSVSDNEKALIERVENALG
ncbi:MAG: hypothetical protein AB8B50_12600 [Pirellulaceae bacterium]